MSKYADNLADCPFSFEESKDGVIRISYKNKLVTTLKGKDATKFSLKMLQAEKVDQQLYMAKATGHFKHGNEKANRR